MDTHYFSKLEANLAAERLDAYRKDGADEITTFIRYLLNMALCESLYSPLQFAEIALRNGIHNHLSQHFTATDWYDKIPSGLFIPWQVQQILNAKDALKKDGKAITPGGMVAELNFGFWTGFFNRAHARSGLGSAICSSVFIHAPRSERDLKKLGTRWHNIRRIRNRVFHHERIIHWADLEQQHANLQEIVGWISPELEQAACALDRFSQIRNEGLTPWVQEIQRNWPKR